MRAESLGILLMMAAIVRPQVSNNRNGKPVDAMTSSLPATTAITTNSKTTATTAVAFTTMKIKGTTQKSKLMEVNVNCWWFCRLDSTSKNYKGSCFSYRRKLACLYCRYGFSCGGGSGRPFR